MRGVRRRRLLGWLAMLTVVATAACAGVPEPRSQQVGEGDPQLGADLIVDYGCVSCHVVPGIRSEPAYVGPPLDHWGLRSYIAGSLPNDEGNLVRWITDPQGVEEGTAMPDLGVSRQEAQHIAAYLLSIE